MRSSTPGNAAQVEPYVAAFKIFQGATGDPPWISQTRRSAMARFAEIGFPTQREEEWKFTSLAPFLQAPFHAAPASTASLSPRDIEPYLFGDPNTLRLVFVNGRLVPLLSKQLGASNSLVLGSLREAMSTDRREIEKHFGSYARYDEQAFIALNTAFFGDGAYLSVPPEEEVETPIHLLFVSCPSGDPSAATHPRNLILAGKSSRVKIIEQYVTLGETRCFTNAVTEILAGPESQLEHLKVQRESDASFHFAAIQARQLEGSRVVSHSVSLGGRIARNDINIVLDAPNCDCVLNGLYLGRHDQLVDHHTRVDHAKSRCTSHEFYHGILGDRAHGVFNGKIYVHADAQKTNAKQTNRNLLLSDDAVVNTKPQLEIYADDVKCTHGATVGQLDENALFYLRSRGIGIEKARRMLIHAFASDVVQRIGMESVQKELERILSERFMREA